VGPLADVAAIDQEDRLIGQDGSEGLHEVLARHRRRRRRFGPPRAILGIALLRLAEPVHAGGQAAPLPLVAQLGEHHGRVAEQSHVRRDTLIHLARLAIQSHHAGLGRNGRRLHVPHTVVDAGPGQHDGVGVGQQRGPAAGSADHAQETRHGPAHAAPVPDGRDDRRAHGRGQAPQRLFPARIEHPAACHDQRALRAGQGFHGLANQIGVGGRARRGGLLGRGPAGRLVALERDKPALHVRLVDRCLEHVGGDRQVHGSGPAAFRRGHGLVHGQGDPLRPVHALDELADGPGQGHVVQVLEIAHARRAALARPRDQ